MIPFNVGTKPMLLNDVSVTGVLVTDIAKSWLLAPPYVADSVELPDVTPEATLTTRVLDASSKLVPAVLEYDDALDSVTSCTTLSVVVTASANWQD